MTFPKITIGLDVGDRYSQVFAVDAEGEVIEEGRLPTTQAALRHRFSGMDRARVVLEVGTHSPWMSRLLTELGHEVRLSTTVRTKGVMANMVKEFRTPGLRRGPPPGRSLPRPCKIIHSQRPPLES